MRGVRHTRGAADPVTWIVLVVVALGGAKMAGWKPLRFLQKKPPTAQVTQLQEELARAQAAAAEARAKLEAAAKAEEQRQDDQVRWSQQMTEGAAAALQRVPDEHRTPETQLAGDLLARANFGLAAAIGALPREKQAEILAIVDKALSNVQAERDEARAALEAKDLELRKVTLERETIRAQIPVLAARLETKEHEAKAVQAELEVKTNEVKVFADLADARERQAGSLGAAVQRWIRITVGLAALWAFLAYVLPPLLKLVRPGRFKDLLRDATGYATGGLLYHDAKRKLRAAKPPAAA